MKFVKLCDICEGSNIYACSPFVGMKYGYAMRSGDKEEHGYLLDFINTVTKKTRWRLEVARSDIFVVEYC